MPLKLIGKDKMALKSADGKHIYIFCSYCNKMIKDVNHHFDGDYCLTKKKDFDDIKKSCEDYINGIKNHFNLDYYTKFLSKKNVEEMNDWIEKLKEILLGRGWRIA